MFEKLVSHKLYSFLEKYSLLPAAQFAHRKGLGCTDAILTISHHLQKSLDAATESYIIQLDFSAAFDSDAKKVFFLVPFNFFLNLQICHLYDLNIYAHKIIDLLLIKYLCN